MCDSNVSILYTTFPHLNYVLSKVVNTVLVLTGIYCTSMYTRIKTSTFHTGLNTGRSMVVNTVPVLAGMYCIGMYTSIEISTFRTDLNTGRTAMYRPISSNTGQYIFFFLSFVIFEFLLG